MKMNSFSKGKCCNPPSFRRKMSIKKKNALIPTACDHPHEPFFISSTQMNFAADHKFFSHTSRIAFLSSENIYAYIKTSEKLKWPSLPSIQIERKDSNLRNEQFFKHKQKSPCIHLNQKVILTTHSNQIRGFLSQFNIEKPK